MKVTSGKYLLLCCPTDRARLVRKVDNTIHWKNHYPVNSLLGFAGTYPLDTDLSRGKRY